MLTNIPKVGRSMTIMCNAGSVVVNMMGTLKGYGNVWYHLHAIENILSLSNVQKNFKVTYDSRQGNYFTIHKSDGTSRIFRPTDKGLYASKKDRDIGVSLISTVEGNKQNYTRREIKRAQDARRLMEIIGRPSERELCRILEARQLKNCETTEQDVMNATDMFGPDVASLKGKTTRQKVRHVELNTRPIPLKIMERHREVKVCFDIMHLNGIGFAVSISRTIKFVTAQALENRRAETIFASLRHINMTYGRRGFLSTKSRRTTN